MTDPHVVRRGRGRATAAAMLAVLVGIGLSRFAYSPLIPVLIDEDWFTPAQTGYLGAANLAGYLLGAVVGLRMVARWSVSSVLRVLMLVVALTFVACATPLSFAWFFAWRLLSGAAGGALMVLAPPTVLAQVPARRRGLAAGLIFSGVGLGIVLSGTLVPALVSLGPATTWIALGALSLVAAAAAWSWWPADASPTATLEASPPPAEQHDLRFLFQPALSQAYAVYGLIAAGLVPHMVFLVDFIARGLGEGIDAGGGYWIAFGIGALGGPLLAGRLADRIGFLGALRWSLFGQATCVGLLVFTEHPAMLVTSSLLAGGALTGSVTLALGRTQEVVAGVRDRRATWSIATVIFAIGQAAAGYGYSFAFAVSDESYRLLFALGTGALVIALMVAWLPVRQARVERVA